MKTIPLHQIVLAHVITAFAIRAVMSIVVGLVLFVGAHLVPTSLLSVALTVLFTAIATYLSAKRIIKKYEIPDRQYVINNSTFLFAFVIILFVVADAVVHGFNFENLWVTLASVFLGIISFYTVSRLAVSPTKVNI